MIRLSAHREASAHLAHLSRSSLLRTPAALRAPYAASLQPSIASARLFSTTPAPQIKSFFPVKETEHIRQTAPAWEHHGYTREELLAVTPSHRSPRGFSEWAAWKIVRIARWGMDTVTGMSRKQKSDPKHPTTAVIADEPFTEPQWFIRFIFLESIAGVPGMVAGMLRHLHSLRRLKRDNGWIETLLEESYNERMHLLIFMKMCEPGWFMKTMILGAQGVFFNSMFIAYLLSPRIVHRFVGYLEEEAVHTYTRAIQEIDAGHHPNWTSEKFQIPDIAVQYYKMPEGQRTMRDLVLNIRADEATHRGVNHTFGNLDSKEDPNPFVSDYKEGMERPKAALKPAGYERSEVI